MKKYKLVSDFKEGFIIIKISETYGFVWSKYF